MGFMTIALPSIKGYTGIFVYVVLYGIGDGIFITTMNSILMFTVDEKRRAAALGLGFSLVSLGIAGGPPLAGEHAQCVRTRALFFFLRGDEGEGDWMRTPLPKGFFLIFCFRKNKLSVPAIFSSCPFIA